MRGLVQWCGHARGLVVVWLCRGVCAVVCMCKKTCVAVQRWVGVYEEELCK